LYFLGNEREKKKKKNTSDKPSHLHQRTPHYEEEDVTTLLTTL
jgi:hypothetical protein